MSDITSQDGDDLWGLPLEDYLRSLKQPPTSSGEQADVPIPSRAQVEAALKKVYARSPSVSCSTFQDILGIAAYPEEVAKIAEEGNKLSFSCVRLLQDYAQRCNGLFYYQYGYLGLRVLVLSLLISFDKYSSRRMGTTFDYTGKTIDDLIYYLTTNAACALSFETTVITGLPLNTQTKSNTDSLGFLMSWRGNLRKYDRDKLLSLLYNDRLRFLRIIYWMPNTQGWMLLLLVLWIPLVPECELTKPKALDALKQLSQLNDLVGRYCLLATEDRTLCIAHAIWRWMYFILIPFTMRPEHYPTPADMDQIPIMRDLAIQRFKFPLHEMDPFECDPTRAELLSVVLGHLNGYQMGSLNASDEDQIPLLEAIFARLWVEIESDRPFYGLEGRDNVHKLTEVVFRCAMGTISNLERMLIHRKMKTVTELRRLSTIYATVFQQADLVDLVGRILLLPISPIVMDDDLVVVEDQESTLEHIGPAWCQIIGCDFMLELLKTHYETVFECFNDDYATWLKVLRFVQIQDRSTSHCKRFFDQCQETWEKFGKALGFLTKDNQRCAYTGCTSPVSLHSAPISCCSGCLSTYYCSSSCQVEAWEIRDSGSHRLECTDAI
ncbi:hypothetical protein FRC08_012611 [Ceratobasidium sp. 394]|nr:hypothetical protein FRC08_012611 [Ceratobasidium sp. 394]